MLTRRDLLSAAGALAAGVLTRSSGFAQSASASAASPDPMSYVNPEFRAALGRVAKMMEAVQSLDASSLASLARHEHAGQRPCTKPAGDGKDHSRSCRSARGSCLFAIFCRSRRATGLRCGVSHISSTVDSFKKPIFPHRKINKARQDVFRVEAHQFKSFHRRMNHRQS